MHVIRSNELERAFVAAIARPNQRIEADLAEIFELLRTAYLPEVAAALRAAGPAAAAAAASAVARCEALLAPTARAGAAAELAIEPIGRRLPEQYDVDDTAEEEQPRRRY